MRCERCQIELLSGQRCCPLCHDPLTEQGIENGYYPVYVTKSRKRAVTLLRRILTFVSMTAILVCTLINILTGGTAWSAIVAISIVGAWVVVNFSSFQRSWLLATVRSLLAGALLVLVIDMLDGKSDWAPSWVLPAIFVATTILLTVFIILKPLRLRDFTMYLLLMTFFGVALMICGLFKLFTPVYPAYIGAVYQILTIIGMMLFSDRSVANEMVKRLHF